MTGLVLLVCLATFVVAGLTLFVLLDGEDSRFAERSPLEEIQRRRRETVQALYEAEASARRSESSGFGDVGSDVIDGTSREVFRP